MDSLKDKAARGLLWGTFTSGATQMLNVVIGIFLARLLSPADVGIVGMITIFTVLANNLQEAGFFTALVNKKEAKDKDYNAVFWFCLALSLIIYFILFLSAPLIAQFFHQPALTWLSRFVFLSFVIASLGIAHSAWMFKRLMVKERAVIMIASLVISGSVGIALALNGYGYWSLAWQQVVFSLIFNIGRFCVTRWHPTFSFSFAPIREMFAFSNKILIPTIVNILREYLLTVVVGRMFSARMVGFFTQSHKWNTMGYQFVGDSVAQIAQPVMVETVDDHQRQLRVVRTMLRYTAFMAFPALFGLALVSREFIVVLLSAKWEPAAEMLRVLAIGGAFMPFYKIYQNFIISLRRSDIYMWLNILHVLLVFGVIIALSRYGIMSMIVGYTLLNILWLSMWQHQAARLSDLRWHHVVKEILPYMLVAAISMVVTWWATRQISSLPLLLVARILAGGCLYIAILAVLKMSLINEIINYFKNKKHINHEKN